MKQTLQTIWGIIQLIEFPFLIVGLGWYKPFKPIFGWSANALVHSLVIAGIATIGTVFYMMVVSSDFVKLMWLGAFLLWLIWSAYNFVKIAEYFK